MRDRLITRNHLDSWSLVTDQDCLLYSNNNETKDHLFFNCGFSLQIWLSFFTHPSLAPPLGVQPIVAWVNRASRSSKVTTICKLLLQAVIYEVEREECKITSRGSKTT